MVILTLKKVFIERKVTYNMPNVKATKVKLRENYEKWSARTIATLVKGDPVTLEEDRLYFSGDPVGHSYYKVKAKGLSGYIREDAIEVNKE